MDRTHDTALDAPDDASLAGLARALVRDAADADDAAQDAWIVLAKKPAPAGTERSRWTFGVLRNVARRRRAREREQRRVERAGARREGAPGADADLERREVEARLVACVRALDEPYRSVVALRYLEELSAEEVAERLGRPAATVRSQTLRGLALLRERLDREMPGGRTAWCASLAMFAIEREPAAPFGHDVLLRVLAGGACAVALIAGAVLLAPERATGGVPLAALESGAPPAASADGLPSDRRPVARAELAPPPAGDPFAPVATQHVEVLTVDAAGEPVAAADVAFVVDGVARPMGRTSAAGRLRLAFTERDLTSDVAGAAPRQLALVAEDQGSATSLLVCVDRARAIASIVRVPLDRGGVLVSGRVLDARGEPVTGASVVYGEPVARRVELEPGVVRYDRGAAVRAGDDGRYALRADRGVVHLRARAPSYPETIFSDLVEEDGRRDWDLAFARGHEVAGVVTTAWGDPAAGARVRVEPGPMQLAHEAQCDAGGRYVLHDVRAGARLVWAVSGAESALLELDARAGATSAWSPRLALRPALRVRLVDELGAPRAGWTVSAFAKWPSSTWQRGLVTDAEGRAVVTDAVEGPVELLVAPLRRAVPYPLLVRRVERVDGAEIELVLSAADEGIGSVRGAIVDRAGRRLDLRLGLVLRGVASGFTNEVALDAEDGAFRVDGLPVGAYEGTLVVRAPTAALVGCVELGNFAIRAGAETDLGSRVLPASGWLEVAGSPNEPGARLEIAATGAFGRVVVLSGRGAPSEAFELLPGVYAVRVLASERVVASGEATVESGARARVVLAR